jgi:hypothetical protein
LHLQLLDLVPHLQVVLQRLVPLLLAVLFLQLWLCIVPPLVVQGQQLVLMVEQLLELLALQLP